MLTTAAAGKREIAPDHVQRVNVTWLAGYLVLAVPVGTLWMLWLLRPVWGWLREDRPPTAAEQRIVLLTPARELLVHGVLWLIGGVVFTVLNLRYSHELALLVAITVGLAALATCAVAYLLAQRILRPVAARALTESVPDDPALPGITTRILLTWALGTGVPVLGVTLVGAGKAGQKAEHGPSLPTPAAPTPPCCTARSPATGTGTCTARPTRSGRARSTPPGSPWPTAVHTATSRARR